MLTALLPPGVVAVEDRGPAPAMVSPWPEEQALVARAVPARAYEFAATRDLARQALAEFGVAPAPVLRGPGGAPRWPTGFVGSLTHCVGYRATAVAPAATVSALGIDAEPAGPLPTGVRGLVASSAESAALDGLTVDDPTVSWDRLLFCAKEAVYKAWFPRTGRWLDFSDVVVELSRAGTYTARLVVPDDDAALVAGLEGRWAAGPDVLVTAAWAPGGG